MWKHLVGILATWATAGCAGQQPHSQAAPNSGGESHFWTPKTENPSAQLLPDTDSGGPRLATVLEERLKFVNQLVPRKAHRMVPQRRQSEQQSQSVEDEGDELCPEDPFAAYFPDSSDKPQKTEERPKTREKLSGAGSWEPRRPPRPRPKPSKPSEPKRPLPRL